MEDKVTRLQLAQTKEFLDINDVALISGFSLSTLHRRVKYAKKQHDVPNLLRPIQQAPNHRLIFPRKIVIDWVSNGAR